MSDELLNPDESKPEEDMNTTPPNPPQSGETAGWSMPEPVFKKTSGYLPQGFEKKFPQVETVPEVGADASVEPEMIAAFAAEDIEPQPEVSEISEEIPVVAAETKANNGGALKVVFSLFGILVALGLVLIFIAVVYYFFVMPSTTGSTL